MDMPATPATGYEFIKQLKRDLRKQGIKRNLPDLLAMSPQNDPFNAGSEGNWLSARWFADQLTRLDLLVQDVHLRRVHYKLVSQKPPPPLWNGKAYENNLGCWGALGIASKQARYLKLVNVEIFDDRRNPDPYLFMEPASLPTPQWKVDYWWTWSLPTIQVELADDLDWSLPRLTVEGYEFNQADQPYLLEVWIEKSTMEDILLPICRRHAANYVPAIGFQSITGTIRMLYRLHGNAKPVRIFYISDFDPAGDFMPPSIARQIEFWLRDIAPDADIKLQPLALTAEQVKHYELPPIPIKEGDKRQNGFKERYGVDGATELDALEALHPGELARLVETAITPYRDQTLPKRMDEAGREARKTLNQAWQERQEEDEETFEDRLENIRERTESILESFKAELEALANRLTEAYREAGIEDDLTELRDDVQRALDDLEVTLPDRPTAQPDPPDESGWLFDARRDYLTQLTFYKDRCNSTGEGDADLNP
ncbi:MAG TPA: hypothetical protein P5552_02490 [Candidatus Competibacteraceae bacterium]|nr:hypothetical protein [Candidatus Competibacteraceae bacterium]